MFILSHLHGHATPYFPFQVVPDAPPAALSLMSRLLSVDPARRPTASEALDFEFLADAEVLCDYSKAYLRRPPRELFDFEHEKYSLEELRGMIISEAKKSATRPIPPPITLPLPSHTGDASQRSVGSHPEAGEAENLEDADTPRLGHSVSSTAIHGHGHGRKSDVGAYGRTAPIPITSGASNGRRASLPAVSGRLLAASGGNLLRAPKTPSPQKMDIILKKGVRAKRLSHEPSGAEGVDIPRADSSTSAVVAPSQSQVSSTSTSSSLAGQLGLMRRSVSAAPPSAATTTGGTGIGSSAVPRSSITSSLGVGQRKQGGLTSQPQPLSGLAGLLSQFSGGSKYSSGNSVGSAVAATASTRNVVGQSSIRSTNLHGKVPR